MKYLTILCVILCCWRVSGYALNNHSVNFDYLDSRNDVEDAALTNIILEIINRIRNVLNDAVIDLIESQRHLIKTGIPPNIPPLDPFYIEEYLLEPDELVGFDNFQMTLKDSFLKGLYDFKIEQVDIRPLRLSAVISISFEKLEMEGLHETRARLFSGIFPINIEGDGRFKLTINNFRVTAYVDLEFNERNRPNLKTIILAYSTLSVASNFEGLGQLTGIFNTAMNIALPAFIIASNVETNLWINQEFIPAVNEIINEFTILDIIGIIRNLIRNNAINFDTEIMNELSRYQLIDSNL